MASFSFEALSAEGRTVRGVLEANSPRAVREQLRQQGLTPLAVEAIETARRPQGPRLPPHALAGLLRRMATLTGAGIPITDALDTLTRQSGGGALQSLLRALRATVAEGESLGTSLARYPQAFPEAVSAAVAAGESGGRLPQVLEQLANAAERGQHLQQRLLAALAYPAVLALVAAAVCVLLLVWVVPQLAGAYLQAGVPLPPLTRALLALADGVNQGWPWLLLLLAGLVLGASLAWQRPEVRLYCAAGLLRLPVIGDVILAQAATRLTRGLALMLGGGVPVVEALRIAAAMVAHPVLAARLQTAREAVTGGATLAQALETTRILPPLTIDLVSTGEATGRLPALLERAADSEEMELASRIDLAVALLEPALVVMVGTVVLVIVLAVLSPLAGLYDQIG